MQKISTCLWFDSQAMEAAQFYVSLFPNSRILDTKYYLENMPKRAGTVLTVQFQLDGTEYTALNGGPDFDFSPAFSLVARCSTQQELDTLWSALGAGGREDRCGWLSDKFGVSWQIVPDTLLENLNSKDAAASQRMMMAMMAMRKLDIAALEKAYRGE
jgi:predicted 3-demethylubiquinone-9 3-methyltransferase (glyoxalase superfamily)